MLQGSLFQRLSEDVRGLDSAGHASELLAAAAQALKHCVYGAFMAPERQRETFCLALAAAAVVLAPPRAETAKKGCEATLNQSKFRALLIVMKASKGPIPFHELCQRRSAQVSAG